MPSLSYPPAGGHLSRVWALACPVCGLPATSYDSRAEAAMLAVVHDELHHRGRPTMTVRGAVACEACCQAATRVAGSPALVLCASCMTVAVDASVRTVVAA